MDLLNQPLPEYVHQASPEPIAFNNHIVLKEAGFRYSDHSAWIFRDLSLLIPKGSRVGFIGTTGSGKSTLLDTVMSLLPLSEGNLEVDDQTITPANQRAWQARIAHVPQSIFLSDSSIAENIAFGVPKDQIVLSRVRLAAQQAQISEAIESWPLQYKTFVGERGIRLSGGQRQRIGIARALYKQSDVIIFDEATSALDNETEEAVMQAIESLSKELTILIIAHRLSTLNICHFILELDQGHLRFKHSYPKIRQPKLELPL
jgi:ATP-binding cassette subfamily B protein